MTPVILVLFVLGWVAVLAIVLARITGAGSASELLQSLTSRLRRVPTERGWSYWVRSNVYRGEHWPLWYWLVNLGISVAVVGVALAYDTPFVVAAFGIAMVAIAYAIYRRLRYGFQGPPRRQPTGF